MPILVPHDYGMRVGIWMTPAGLTTLYPMSSCCNGPLVLSKNAVKRWKCCDCSRDYGSKDYSPIEIPTNPTVSDVLNIQSRVRSWLDCDDVFIDIC